MTEKCSVQSPVFSDTETNSYDKKINHYEQRIKYNSLSFSTLLQFSMRLRLLNH